MIEKLWVFWEESTDPYHNLAVEQHLTSILPPDSCILYLWQNDRSVVIGRNQNPWSECAVSQLKTDHISLVRRLSGGGAVYHDLGNLNYTFITTRSDYDPQKQLSVIVQACEQMGIRATVSGRNDILAANKKFSGTAFYHSKAFSFHHGTILINTDLSNMSQYLTPPVAKLQAKGITSVRSRVINLSELCPDLTPHFMSEQILLAFETIYQHKPIKLALQSADHRSIEEKERELSSPQWIYQNTPPFNLTITGSFPWGSVQLLLQIEHAIICHVTLYTDAIEHSLSSLLYDALLDCPFTVSAMEKAIRNSRIPPLIQTDLCTMIAQQHI